MRGNDARKRASDSDNRGFDSRLKKSLRPDNYNTISTAFKMSTPPGFRIAQAVGLSGAIWLSGNVFSISMMTIPGILL
ncbi:hypothetical protein BDW62DRAFT_198176 [Aspergillus aurantiobrunneus]